MPHGEITCDQCRASLVDLFQLRFEHAIVFRSLLQFRLVDQCVVQALGNMGGGLTSQATHLPGDGNDCHGCPPLLRGEAILGS